MDKHYIESSDDIDTDPLDIMFEHSRHSNEKVLATLKHIKHAQKLLASIPAVVDAGGNPDNIIRLMIFLAESRAQGYEPDSSSIAVLLGSSRSTFARRIEAHNADGDKCPGLVRQGHRLVMEVEPLSKELVEFVDYWADHIPDEKKKYPFWIVF